MLICWYSVNPLLPSVPYMTRLAKILISISEGIINKISYERIYYESVGEKSLSLAIKKNQAVNYWYALDGNEDISCSSLPECFLYCYSITQVQCYSYQLDNFAALMLFLPIRRPKAIPISPSQSVAN